MSAVQGCCSSADVPRFARQRVSVQPRPWVDQVEAVVTPAEGRLTNNAVAANQRAALAQFAKSALVEFAAIEVVSVGRALFKDGAPRDPESQRRYRLYKRLKVALALSAGPQRLEALHKVAANSGRARHSCQAACYPAP